MKPGSVIQVVGDKKYVLQFLIFGIAVWFQNRFFGAVSEVGRCLSPHLT